MKKLFSLLLVAVMVFGMATTAFAYTDVTATAQTGPVEKLNALGILKGYADGTFKPENPITRAEFAAVIVRTMGLEQAATLINNPTKFSDVTAQYAWAYGYINIATAKGVIKGDPDGKFRPADKVSYAEVVTMILRAGGWDAACSTMDWPAGFVMKAVEFGLTDDVNFDAAAAANRGAVAIMTYNALSMPIAKWNDVAKVWDVEKDGNNTVTVAAKYLKAVEENAVVAAVPMTNSSLKANEIMIGATTYTIPAGVDANALFGRDVRIVRIDKSITYIKDITDPKNIVSGKFVSLVGTTLTLTVTTDSDTTLNTIVTPVQIRNNAAVAGGNALTEDDSIVAIKDSTGNVRCIIAKQYTAEQVVVTAKTVKSATATDTFTAGDPYDVLANTVFTLNGKPATFADLAVGQVAYVQAVSGDAVSVDLYNTVVTGKVTAVALNAAGEGVLTINGTNYVVDADATMTLDEQPLVNGIGDFVNFDASLKLNAVGKACVVSGTTTALMGKVTKIDADNSKITVAIKGVATEFTYMGALAGTIAESDYVTLTQRADGKVTSVVEYGLPATDYTVKAIDTTNKKITLENGGTYTIVSYSTNTFGVRLGTWGDINLLKVNDVVRYDNIAAGTMKYFEVNPSAAGSVYGKILGTTTVDAKTYLYVNVKGEVKSYVEDAGMTGVPANDTLMVLTLNSVGAVTDVADLAYSQNVTSDADNVMTVVAISGNLITVSYDANGSAAGTTPAYRVIDITNAVIYSGTTLKAAADLPIGETFTYVEGANNTVAALISIQ